MAVMATVVDELPTVVDDVPAVVVNVQIVVKMKNIAGLGRLQGNDAEASRQNQGGANLRNFSDF